MTSALVLAWVVGSARAENAGTSVGISLAGESLRDPWLVAGYEAEGLGGALHVSFPLPVHLRLTVEVGYHRRGGSVTAEDGSAVGASWLQYTPMAAPVLYDLDLGAVTLAAGLGPAYVVFAEPAVPDDAWSQTGGKFGLVLRGEARVPTGLVQPSAFGERRGPSSLDLVVDAGYRKSFRHLLHPGNPDGLDFSALTAGVGLELVY